ncbi:MAG: hypothetical protein NT120_02580 [Candidatus Aenigmarchaeota archaeon]|nr:hypothetical protein [Candidatus Aenigmarchaeota archaeon]
MTIGRRIFARAECGPRNIGAGGFMYDDERPVRLPSNGKEIYSSTFSMAVAEALRSVFSPYLKATTPEKLYEKLAVGSITYLVDEPHKEVSVLVKGDRISVFCKTLPLNEETEKILKRKIKKTVKQKNNEMVLSPCYVGNVEAPAATNNVFVPASEICRC